MTNQEQEQLEESWNILETNAWDNEDSSVLYRQEAIRTIVVLNEKQLRPWLPEAAIRLERLADDGTGTKEQIVATLDKLSNVRDRRFSNLMRKLISRLQHEDQEDDQDDKPSETSKPSVVVDWSNEPWKSVTAQVEGLSMSMQSLY